YLVKNRMKNFKILCLVALFLMPFHGNAQHLYYRMDVATNNVYSFAVANLATAGINALTDEMLFDNAYTYTYIRNNDKSSDTSIKNPNILGLTARDIFGDITVGGKLGYQSFFPGSFNWGLYGSAHYRINQYKVEDKNNSVNCRNNVHRLILGGGILLNFGSIESSTRFVFEASFRYELPVHYNGISGLKQSEMLNEGFSSHYALRINGNGILQGLGVYADVPHYNMFKKSGMQYGTPDVKMYSFGIMYTITPWKIKDIY
ncbi:MAG: hypothetical protein Q4E63_09735, partial [Prevotellaceae bacterium]|nr:hypothetical protein [Prevotellaceae bacterium]